ncbi:hypothetical protein [Bacillus sp. X1(2014)]|nr:hypothetical protein [Bacillus sp. X1(2014)]
MEILTILQGQERTWKILLTEVQQEQGYDQATQPGSDNLYLL